MPANTDFMIDFGKQPLGEFLRGDSVAARGSGKNGKSSLRPRGVGNGQRTSHSANSENINPNIAQCGPAGNGRKSPRIGLSSAPNNGRQFHGYPTSRQSAPLTDITNVSSKNSQHGKLERVKQYAQLPQPLPASPVVRSRVVHKEEAAQSVKLAHEEMDKSNVQDVAEYASDIFSKLLCDEAADPPRPDYMDSQTDLSPKMRTILMDWIIEVHLKYRLRSETLHLTVNLVDRYLSRKNEVRRRLQLVGVVAIMIASKFEEIHPPELRDWVFICDNAYAKEDVLFMECSMLTTLSFQISVPTAAHFFEVLQRANGCDDVHREVAPYLLELGLLELHVLQHTPSQFVSAALLLSNQLLGRSPAWPATMVQQSCHSECALQLCVEELRQLLEADRAGEGGQLQAVHKKFSMAEHMAVAKMAFPGLP